MYLLRRWWDRYGLQIVLVSLALGTAWGIRQTQGSVIFEVYQVIVRPFQPSPTQVERLGEARMLELQARVVELESQNQRLKQLLGYVKQSGLAGAIAAPVIGRSADHWWQQVTLGRGSQDGIATGFVVTATGGLVGRIVSVTPHTSRVLLISDPTSQVGVVLSRSRYMGSLRGSTSLAIMQFFDKVPDVHRGDVVSTSAYSQIFPSGLPIGRVESVNLRKSPAPEAVVSLFAPIPYLEWVVVYPKTRGQGKTPHL